MSAVMYAVSNPGTTVRIHSPAPACFDLINQLIRELPHKMEYDFTLDFKKKTLVYKQESRPDENKTRKEGS
jgi:hypothetical protein